MKNEEEVIASIKNEEVKNEEKEEVTISQPMPVVVEPQQQHEELERSRSKSDNEWVLEDSIPPQSPTMYKSSPHTQTTRTTTI